MVGIPDAVKTATDYIPRKLKNTAFLRLWALRKVPMINWVRPVVLELDEQLTKIKIPLNWRTRNHLGSMYFGTLCVGADVAGGLIAVKIMAERGEKFSFVFKDYQAEFHKRPLADVVFTCKDGLKMQALVEKASQSGERLEEKITVIGHCPSLDEEPVATFQLTLSVKKK